MSTSCPGPEISSWGSHRRSQCGGFPLLSLFYPHGLAGGWPDTNWIGLRFGFVLVPALVSSNLSLGLRHCYALHSKILRPPPTCKYLPIFKVSSAFLFILSWCIFLFSSSFYFDYSFIIYCISLQPKGYD